MSEMTDEKRARELIKDIECNGDDDLNPWDVMKAKKALAAVRAEAALAEREVCANILDDRATMLGKRSLEFKDRGDTQLGDIDRIASHEARGNAAAIRARTATQGEGK